jgi:hypothetical protein
MRNKILLFIILLTSSLLSSQNFVGENFRLSADSGNVVITFEDQNSDGVYIGGVLTKSFGQLTITREEFKTKFIANLKKISGKKDYEIVEDSYRLDKYSFDTESVFIQVGNKIGSITKEEIKKLRKL